MRHETLLAILDNIKILDRRFIATPTTHGWHLQVTYNEVDIETGALEQQYSRKWFISDEATETDVVDTAFACVMRSYDHVVQEHFTYKGHRVFSPHFTIQQRINAAIRQEAEAEKERCACGHDLDYRDSHYRNMHNATCQAQAQKRVEDAIAGFEHWLHQNMFSQADELLTLYKIENCDPAMLLGILSITFHAKDRLKNRDDFLRRAEVRLRATLGDERADDLLRSRR